MSGSEILETGASIYGQWNTKSHITAKTLFVEKISYIVTMWD